MAMGRRKIAAGTGRYRAQGAGSADAAAGGGGAEGVKVGQEELEGGVMAQMTAVGDDGRMADVSE